METFHFQPNITVFAVFRVNNSEKVRFNGEEKCHDVHRIKILV